MIEALIKLAVNKIIPLLVFLPLIFYITYTEYESILISTIVSLVFFLLWYFYNMYWKGRKRVKCINTLLKEGFPFSDDEPLIPSENESYGEGWEQGFGYTDNEGQPMWVKANEEGVTVFYLCIAQKNPFILPWERITQIRISDFLIGKKNSLLARIYIPGIGMTLWVPWHRRFDQFIPEDITVEG